ncbi:Non-like end-joining factor 1 [Dissostichus eleginoides]|uniref:Non-homologous end-joining factor 1 n=1 Tax=Dissostichus eleginoides TaxID=100907 RepID=A0AAD9B472_DISEL|nr:Non-like end-joining factor 1 [Dissostichus eleginoides]
MEVLLQRPWLPVSINGVQLLSKSCFGETEYHILLTDMKCVWEERMESADIEKRAQELNRRLRAPVKAFFSHLSEVVRPALTGSGGGTNISVTQEDGNINMKLKSELAGLPFYWEFHCTPAPVTVALPLLVSDQSDSLQFDGGLQQLYSAVVSHGNSRKRKLSEEPSVEEMPADEPDITYSLGGSKVDSGAAEEVQLEAAGAKMADRATEKKSLSSAPAERPSAKPKKKKVGLFR